MSVCCGVDGGRGELVGVDEDDRLNSKLHGIDVCTGQRGAADAETPATTAHDEGDAAAEEAIVSYFLY